MSSNPGSRVELFQVESPEKSKGCYVTVAGGFAIVVVVAAALVAVGLGVHFGRGPCPTCRVPPTLSPDQKWEECKRMAADRGECLCNTTTREITGFRLNRTLLPEHYNVELTPDIYLPRPGFKIPGKVEIWMRCNQATNMLVLHIERMVIHETTIRFRENGPSGRVIAHSRWEEDKDRLFFKLYLNEDLVVGRTYYFTVEFQGTLNHPDLGGFYYSSYQQGNQTRYLAVTQFQRSHARRAFPNFDEPSFKATFNITLVRKPGYTSLSNMDLLYTEQRDGGYEADVYNRSVIMSSYLVAFVVSDFVQKNYTTQRGTFFRHWARRDYEDQIDYALNISGYILEAFEDYTGIPYPLIKTDQIAVPDFRAGAMENWGLVTYREGLLLYHANYSTMANKRAITSVISHELAHKWWGNLVTCEWWGDTFLNEAFATYYAAVGVDMVLPHWKMEEDYMRSFMPIMETDGYTTSQPIRLTHVESHNETGLAFRGQTYRKGGSILRMINYFLGFDTFRRAMTYYLNKHAYSNVIAEDLYSALQRQAEIDGRVTWDTSRRNLSLILQTWMDQQGHPTVTVSHRGSGKYLASQEMFLYDPENTPQYPSRFGFTWDIPFAHSTEQQAQNNQSNLTWLYRGDLEFDTTDVNFLLGNYRHQGFFRVNYEDQLWDKMVARLNSNHKFFNEYNRAEFVDDALNLARINRRTEVQAMRTTEYLINELEYLPWFAFDRRIEFYDRMFFNTETYGIWQRYLLDRAVTNVYGYVTWDDSNEDEHHEKYLRALIISIACSRGYEPCLSEARRQYRQFMDNENVNPTSPNLRSTVYCEGIKSGGSAEWDFAYKMYERKYDGFIANEKIVLLEAMTCSRMPWILRRYLNMIANEHDISGNVVIWSIARNPVGTPLVWDFLTSRWNNWPEHLSKSEILRSLTSTYSTRQDLEKFDAFTRMFPDEDMQSTYSSIRATIQNNIRWTETNEVPLRNWFISVNNKQGKISKDAERSLGDTFISAPGTVPGFNML